MLQNLLNDQCLTQQSIEMIRHLDTKTSCASCRNCSMYSYYTTDSEAMQKDKPYKIIHFHLRCTHQTDTQAEHSSCMNPAQCHDYQEI